MPHQRDTRAVTDDRFTLNQADAVRWDDIVIREWPSDGLTHTSMEVLDADASSDTNILGADEYPTLTIYFPRPPATLPLAISAMLTGTAVWATVNLLVPAFRLASLPGAPARERSEAVHQLTITAVVTAVLLLFAATTLTVWLVAFARYRLRRAACDQVVLGRPASTRRVRPPNPVTAATWVILLLTGSTAAWWWIVSRLEGASSPRFDAAASLHDAAIGAIAWLGITLLCAVALSTWAAREARHRLRRSASTQPRQ